MTRSRIAKHLRAVACCCLVAAPSLVACSSEDPDGPGKTPAPGTEDPLPVTLETVPCRYVVPKSVEGTDFSCGDQPVPENRAKEGSRSISLHVIVFRGKKGGVPTIILEGGPGGSAESEATGLAMKDPVFVERFEKLLGQGDVVMFDQRGVGRSTPRLTCVPEETKNDPDPAGTCFARLEKSGVDFAGYDSAANADDVADIAKAIGARKVNLLGISYGSRLGLEVLRRHPDIVRGAVVDGVLPAEVKIFTDTMPNLDATITHIFQACAADATCNTTYPDLDGSLVKLKAKLDATPFTAGSFTFDWTEFVGTVFDTLYEDGSGAQLPYFVHTLLKQTQAEWSADQSAQNAKYEKAQKAKQDALSATPLGKEVLDRLAGSEGKLHDEIAGDLAFGMYAAVSCADSGQYETLEDAVAALASVRKDLRAFGEAEARSAFAGCRTLPSIAPKSDIAKPVTAAVPTIVIGGDLDPITPSKNARAVASALAGSQLVVVPSGAHGFVNECGTTLKAGFLSTLKPVDAACAAGGITFYYGGQGVASMAGPAGVRPARAARGGGRTVERRSQAGARGSSFPSPPSTRR